MPGFVDLIIYQGATFGYEVVLLDDVSNTAINIADYSFVGTMKKSFSSTANVSGILTISKTDSSNGKLNVGMSAANSKNTAPGRHYYDVFAYLNGTLVEKILEGEVEVQPAISNV